MFSGIVGGFVVLQYIYGLIYDTNVVFVLIIRISQTIMKQEQKVTSYIDEIFPPDDIPSYQVKKIIGKGSYGHVAKASRKNQAGSVAIKKITGLFNSLPETRRILREIVLLKNCKHPNIVHLIDVMMPKSQNEHNFTQLYLVTEYCDSDLAKVFRLDGNYLEIEHIRHISYQLMCGLKYLHSANIIHRDLKPANVLINTKGLTVKICDFGLSRIVGDEALENDKSEQESDREEQKKGSNEPAAQEKSQAHNAGSSRRGGKGGLKRMGTGAQHIESQQDKQQEMRLKKQQKLSNPMVKLTLRVTTRWYRAPEIILLDKDYNKPIDIWSAGCILGQLLKMQRSVCADTLQRFPLFPGKYCYPVSPSTLGAIYKNGYPQGRGDQLYMILSAIGKPTEEQISFLTDEKAKDYVRKLEIVGRKTFDEMFPKVDKSAIEVLKNALKFSPNDRATIDQILNSKFYEPIRNKKLEEGRDPIEMNPQIENESLTLQQLRKCILKQISLYFQPGHAK